MPSNGEKTKMSPGSWVLRPTVWWVTVTSETCEEEEKTWHDDLHWGASAARDRKVQGWSSQPGTTGQGQHPTLAGLSSLLWIIWGYFQRKMLQWAGPSTLSALF